MRYTCTDGNADVVIDAGSAREAAEEYVTDGDWGDRSETSWVTVYCRPTDGDGDVERVKIELPAEEPACAAGQSHDWQEAVSARGSGGGVLVQDACRHCSLQRYTDTWATDPTDGEGGLTHVSYQDGW